MSDRSPLTDVVRDSKLDSKLETEVFSSASSALEHVFYDSREHKNQQPVRREERWVHKALVGRGTYSSVFLEQRDHADGDRQLRAVKRIDKSVALENGLDYTRELEAFAKFSHQKYWHCFVRSYGWFENDDSVYITMEYLENGNLGQHLKKPLPEAEARQITGQVLEGLIFMHQNGFTHRDLKPEKIMVVTTGPDWFVKITNSGSKKSDGGVGRMPTAWPDTQNHNPPEDLSFRPSQVFTSSYDMWSLGVVAYRMFIDIRELSGLVDLVRARITGDFPIATLVRNRVSQEGREFILKLVNPNPNARLTASAASQHPWMTMQLAPETGNRSLEYVLKLNDDVSTKSGEVESESAAQGHRSHGSFFGSGSGLPSTQPTSLSESQPGRTHLDVQLGVRTASLSRLDMIAESELGCNRHEDNFDAKSQRSVASYNTSASSSESYQAIFVTWVSDIIENRLHWNSSEDLALLYEILPEVLREFSTRLCRKGKSDAHRKVMWYVHKMCNGDNSSHSVVTSTLEGLQPELGPAEQDDDIENVVDSRNEDVDQEAVILSNADDDNRDKSSSMSLEEKMARLMDSQDRDSVADVRERYRDILQDPEEENWVLSSLTRYRGLRGIDPLDKKAIRRSVFTALRTKAKGKSVRANQRYADPARITRNMDAPTSDTHFEVQWNPVAFVNEVRIPSSEDDVPWPREHDGAGGIKQKSNLPLIARLITVTGNQHRVQALPCREYMIQTWPLPTSNTPKEPLPMPPLLSLIRRLIDAPNADHTEELPWGSWMRARLGDGGVLCVSVHGTDYEIAEVSEQLGWLGSALRTPAQKGGLSICYSELTAGPPGLNQSESGSAFSMRLEFSEKQIDLDTGLNMCWKGFFRNLTIARGYPIPSRPDRFDGLQIPLHHAANIIRARRLDRFRSRYMVKGYSSVLYPTRVDRLDKFITWHFIGNRGDSHLSYADLRIGHGEDEESVRSLQQNDIENASHVIGWCPDVKKVAGTRHADYSSIYFSGVEQVTDYEATLEKVEISGGTSNFKLAGTLALCKRLRGESLQFDQSQNNWVKSIEAVGKRGKCVILYDKPEQRAWLVDGYSALLHLFRASLQNDSEGRSRNLYVSANDSRVRPSDKQFELAKLDRLERELEQKEGGDGGLDSVPLEILTSRKICSLEMRHQSYGPTSQGTDKETGFYVADRIRDLVEGLEKMQAMAAASTRGALSGVTVSTSSETVLEGYDFWDVASLEGAGTLPARSVRLHKVAKGWIKFARSIGAVALFGKGFGNILRPVEMSNEAACCRRCLWNMPMPCGKDMLALAVVDLEYLHREEWRTADTSDRMVRMLFPWKNPAGCFNPCLGSSRNSHRSMACPGPLRMQAFLPATDVGKEKMLSLSKARSWTRELLLRPSAAQSPTRPGVTTKTFYRNGAIVLGVPDRDLRRGRIAFTASAATAAAASEADEGQGASSVVAVSRSGDSRNTAASVTSAPSDYQDSSMVVGTLTTDSS
ncbi:hypothetical protein JDV02_004502 [Purpureocillium takamizusanense]|uniref:non-specific serine/threonine protein kinase n=1 Tax=Purpureocillium takamizusanense TaxID=2060973 RepID=A0A9Q8QEM1_9HYPO|nr:uncharacterized protein JDV02_004502 [Purpureocillium takamizusanense]UNI18220.1 hypothetical protein JDV02_004502 [Purpureocillium takamizusanense]